jgi:hypothetical protein
MEISDRIKKLGNFFSQMQIVPDGETRVIYVVVRFPSTWQVDEDIAKKHGVTIADGDTLGEYYFATDIDTGEGAIFDTIDETIDKMKEAIERSELYTKANARLRKIFEDETIPIQKLRTIEFKFIDEQNEMIIPKSKKEEKKNE